MPVWPMREIADWVLNLCNANGVQYAEARIVDERQRALGTKNGKIGSASDSESLGLGVRVLTNGAWGFAATEDLTRAGVETAAALALEIARASAQVKQQDVRLAPEKAYQDDWSSPCAIDPFGISIEENLDLLLKIDAELRSVAGVTLAETNLNFRRYEQWFYNSDGSDIHQLRYSTGAGYAALAFESTEIMKRSFPNSFGGQWQDKGYELVHELKLLENARRIGEEAVALHQADQCPEG
ncbi:MAG: PmbA/TldA family metallopeptidase, partial [Chthoniobacterales bacterium]